MQWYGFLWEPWRNKHNKLWYVCYNYIFQQTWRQTSLIPKGSRGPLLNWRGGLQILSIQNIFHDPTLPIVSSNVPMFSRIHMLFCQTVVVFGKPSALVCLIMISHKTPCFFLRLAICWHKGNLYLFVFVSAPFGKQKKHETQRFWIIIWFYFWKHRKTPTLQHHFLICVRKHAEAMRPLLEWTILSSTTPPKGKRTIDRGAVGPQHFCKFVCPTEKVQRIRIESLELEGTIYQPALKCPSHIVPSAKLVGLHIQIWSTTWYWKYVHICRRAIIGEILCCLVEMLGLTNSWSYYKTHPLNKATRSSAARGAKPRRLDLMAAFSVGTVPFDLTGSMLNAHVINP